MKYSIYTLLMTSAYHLMPHIALLSSCNACTAGYSFSNSARVCLLLN